MEERMNKEGLLQWQRDLEKRQEEQERALKAGVSRNMLSHYFKWPLEERQRCLEYLEAEQTEKNICAVS
jgi:hypothetical protein